ncbi:hypothetical protein DFH28DRAFT_940412 [Melampsora americana]|nr:hypothetical protein DFH28DRAFT_940412 [Melampsora americana]
MQQDDPTSNLGAPLTSADLQHGEPSTNTEHSGTATTGLIRLARSTRTPDPEDHHLTAEDWATSTPKSPLAEERMDRGISKIWNECSIEQGSTPHSRNNKNIIPDSEDEDSLRGAGRVAENAEEIKVKRPLDPRFKNPSLKVSMARLNLTASTRTIEINKAIKRVKTWQDLYDSTKARVDAILEEEDAEDDAIMEELAELLKDLEKYNVSVTEKKLKLDLLTSQGCEGDIEITVFDPANIRKRPYPASSTVSPTHQTRPKRQKTTPSYKESQPKKPRQTPKQITPSSHTQQADPNSHTQQPTSAATLFAKPSRHDQFGKIMSISHLLSNHGSSHHILVLQISYKTSLLRKQLLSKLLRKLLPSNQFNWGRALGPSVRNLLSCWCRALPTVSAPEYAEQNGSGCASDEGHMWTQRNAQLSQNWCVPHSPNEMSYDQFFTKESLNWQILNDSIKHPWTKRTAFFRALHSMACRTNDSLHWTSQTGLKSKLNYSYLTLRQILSDSIELVTFHMTHTEVNIQTTGDYAVPEDMVDLSKGIGWIYQQIMVHGQAEEENENKAVHKRGIAWLQQRYLQVIMGVMLIYESHRYNEKFDAFVNDQPRTQAQIRNEKKTLKDASCLNQLSLGWVNRHSKGALKLDNESKSVTDTTTNKQTEVDRQNQATRDASETRSDALRALSLFLVYGTAGLFHVWTNRREVTLHDPSYLLKMGSIFALRYINSSDSNKDNTVFNNRAWCRLDELVITTIGSFITEDGKFDMDFDWPHMTSMINEDFDTSRLSALFIMDIYGELGKPGQSRSPDGSEAPAVFFSGRKNFPDLKIGDTESADESDS